MSNHQLEIAKLHPCMVTVVSCYLSTESQIFTVEKPDLFATLSKI